MMAKTIKQDCLDCAESVCDECDPYGTLTDAQRIECIRDIVTEWNFGPVNSRWAMDAIFAIVGDHIQGRTSILMRRTSITAPTDTNSEQNSA